MCDNCFTSCVISPCYGNIWIGKATPLNTYLVVITNSIGRRVTEHVTANSEGLVKISGGTFSEFFQSGQEFKFQLFQEDFSQVPAVTSNIAVDFYAITNFAGAYYDIEPEYSSTVYDCALVNFEMIYDGDGDPVELDNQYLLDV